ACRRSSNLGLPTRCAQGGEYDCVCLGSLSMLGENEPSRISPTDVESLFA
ncbi:hypothetical protein A2U01_0109831, partial [Trifolium medium]|nr:hypothetical protein [Trifolium medium]